MVAFCQSVLLKTDDDDDEIASSRPVHCRVTYVNSAFYPSRVGKSSTGLLAGVKTGRVHCVG